jgi:hypothetical protein
MHDVGFKQNTVEKLFISFCLSFNNTIRLRLC